MGGQNGGGITISAVGHANSEAANIAPMMSMLAASTGSEKIHIDTNGQSVYVPSGTIVTAKELKTALPGAIVLSGAQDVVEFHVDGTIITENADHALGTINFGFESTDRLVVTGAGHFVGKIDATAKDILISSTRAREVTTLGEVNAADGHAFISTTGTKSTINVNGQLTAKSDVSLVADQINIGRGDSVGVKGANVFLRTNPSSVGSVSIGNRVEAADLATIEVHRTGSIQRLGGGEITVTGETGQLTLLSERGSIGQEDARLFVKSTNLVVHTSISDPASGVWLFQAGGDTTVTGDAGNGTFFLRLEDGTIRVQDSLSARSIQLEASGAILMAGADSKLICKPDGLISLTASTLGTRETFVAVGSPGTIHLQLQSGDAFVNATNQVLLRASSVDGELKLVGSKSILPDENSLLNIVGTAQITSTGGSIGTSLAKLRINATDTIEALTTLSLSANKRIYVDSDNLLRISNASAQDSIDIEAEHLIILGAVTTNREGVFLRSPGTINLTAGSSVTAGGNVVISAGPDSATKPMSSAEGMQVSGNVRSNVQDWSAFAIAGVNSLSAVSGSRISLSLAAPRAISFGGGVSITSGTPVSFAAVANRAKLMVAKDDTVRIWQSDVSSISKASDGSIHIYSGSVVIEAVTDTKIRSQTTLVTAKKGSIIQLIESKIGTIVRALADTKHGAITVSIGGHSFDLPIGNEFIAAHPGLSEPDVLKEAFPVGRRIGKKLCVGAVECSLYEFSLPGLLGQDSVLSEMYRYAGNAPINRLLKNAAAISLITAHHGSYQLTRR